MKLLLSVIYQKGSVGSHTYTNQSPFIINLISQINVVKMHEGTYVWMNYYEVIMMGSIYERCIVQMQPLFTITLLSPVVFIALKKILGLIYKCYSLWSFDELGLIIRLNDQCVNLIHEPISISISTQIFILIISSHLHTSLLYALDLVPILQSPYMWWYLVLCVTVPYLENSPVGQ